MTKKELRIVFMGTPEFAVPSLKILVESGYNVVGVVTAPDRKAGRGQKLRMSDVKEYAIQLDIPILQPTNLKDPDFIEELTGLKANLQIVVAFRMLPEMVWDMPEIGTFNLHGSLLPNYRGAAPINWAIMNGEKETGVTTFFLKHKIDTGDVLFQEREVITKDDTVGTLYERLMHIGAKLVLLTTKAIETDDYDLKPQNLTGNERSAPKIFKETCEINWNQNGALINDFIRGLSPYPVAWTTLMDKSLKIFGARVELSDSDESVGTIDTDSKTYLRYKCLDGWIYLNELQLEGKKRMKTEDFLRGFQVPSSINNS